MDLCKVGPIPLEIINVKDDVIKSSGRKIWKKLSQILHVGEMELTDSPCMFLHVPVLFQAIDAAFLNKLRYLTYLK